MYLPPLAAGCGVALAPNAGGAPNALVPVLSLKPPNGEVVLVFNEPKQG